MERMKNCCRLAAGITLVKLNPPPASKVFVITGVQLFRGSSRLVEVNIRYCWPAKPFEPFNKRFPSRMESLPIIGGVAGGATNTAMLPLTGMLLLQNNPAERAGK